MELTETYRMGKHKKRKLDADRTDLDDQDKGRFFCPPKKKKSKSMSDLELEKVEHRSL